MLSCCSQGGPRVDACSILLYSSVTGLVSPFCSSFTFAEVAARILCSFVKKAEFILLLCHSLFLSMCSWVWEKALKDTFIEGNINLNEQSNIYISIYNLTQILIRMTENITCFTCTLRLRYNRVSSNHWKW